MQIFFRPVARKQALSRQPFCAALFGGESSSC